MMMKTPFCLAACLFAFLPAVAQNAPSVNADLWGHALPAQKYTHVFGQEIAYYDMGTARPGEPVLVMLHGYGSQADVDFGPSLPLLAKHHRVIALDQIGAGQSAKPLIEYRVQTYVEFLAEFLRTQGITKFDLLGESLGGWTAAAYAEQSLAAGSTLPKPTRLILEDAAGFTVPDLHSAGTGVHLSVSTVGEVVTGLRAVFYNKALITEEVARRRFITKLAANDGLVTSTFSNNPAVRTEAVGDKAASISVPTLVVWGAEDTTVPITMGQAFARAIPRAKLVTIDESGHVPSLEQPVRFVTAVEGFLLAK